MGQNSLWATWGHLTLAAGSRYLLHAKTHQEGARVITIHHSNRFGRPTRVVCDEHTPPVELVIPEDSSLASMEERLWAFVRTHRSPAVHRF
jgi:hypothetical protein